MLGVNMLVRLIYTVKINNYKESTNSTPEKATRESIAGSIAFLIVILLFNLMYRIPFVERIATGANEVNFTMVIIIVGLLIFGLAYFALARFFTDERIIKIYNSKAVLESSSAKGLYAIWIFLYLIIMLVSAFTIIFS